jgi:hypothetical protein
MPTEKETDKGLMHSFFGHELCEGCKGLLIVAYVTPSQKDITSFAGAFSKQQAALKKAGANLAAVADAEDAQFHAVKPRAKGRKPRGNAANKR